MDFFGFLTMLGGLALFLYGMKEMGDALAKMAGGRLESVLEKMTSNRVKAVLLGLGVTAVIQSSSGTTVMVVGFVNSGIMKLTQAIGVIMGANIGTTVTSWLLSLTGIQSDNFIMSLLKPTSFSPVLAMIGIVLVMFLKGEKKKDFGTILIGFAVLMFGMDTMSSAVKPLANVPEFTSLFTAFENPILGMLVGALLTAIIQSSSASVGILQAMCLTGSVSIGAAIPVIMGQNIGTCVTALLSSIGASKNGKRAALIHLYFNLIGTIIFMIVFYSLNAAIHFAFLSDTASVMTIAVVHSAFNIAATIVLFPAAKLLERLAYLTIPKTEDEDATDEIKVLDERFLETPAFAVAQCKSVICDMAQLIEKSMGLTTVLRTRYDEDSAGQVMDIEAEMDIQEDELSTYLTKLAEKSMTSKDSRLVGMYSRSIIDLERISDYLKGIVYTEKKLASGKDGFSEEASEELGVIFDATQEIVENTVHSLVHEDFDMARRIDPQTDTISALKKEIRHRHNKRLSEGKCSVDLGTSLSDITNSLERIAKHCSNIAEEEIASVTDEYALHRYARSMKEGDEFYREVFEEFGRKYALTSSVD